MTPAARHVRAALLFLVCGIVLFFFDPATTGLYPPCLFKTFLGVQCPGCGSLRAMHQLLHGNVAAAWALNKLVFIALPLAAAATLLTLPGRSSSSP
jgi:hypothetical protein